MHITQSPTISELWKFEKASWSKSLRASRQVLINRWNDFPQGIFMLGDICQVTVVPKHLPDEIKTFEQMRDLQVDLGSRDLWVLNIATHLKAREQGHASTLVMHVVDWAKDTGKYDTIQTAITCPGVREGSKPPVRMFPEGVEEIRLIPNYWEADTESNGYGMLIKLTL